MALHRPIAERSAKPASESTRPIAKALESALGDPVQPCYQWVIKTNVAYLAATVANLGVEFAFGKHYSVDLPMIYSPYTVSRTFRLRFLAVQPEFRYWFGGRPMMREFIGVAALGTSYDITWGSETYKGDAWGGGLTFGYAFFLSPHWNIECYGSVGAVYYDHKHYYRDDHYSENRRTAHGYAFIPFKLGVSFAYIIK